jgi:putative nucleotidyltransferase with HDIG domain
MSLLGLTYTGFHGAAAVFYPAAGVYAALYFLFRKQVLPGLMIGILAANLIYRLTQIDEAIWITLILSLIFLGSNLVEMIVFSILLDRAPVVWNKRLSIQDLAIYVLVVVVATIPSALIGTLGLSLFYGMSDFWNGGLFWWIGSAAGILIFGSLIINSHYYDDSMLDGWKRWPQNLVYLVILLVVVFFVFVDTTLLAIPFSDYQILIVLLYIIAAFRLTFRMIALSNLTIIIGLNSFYLVHVSESVYLAEGLQINVFLLVLSSIASVVRIILLERQENYDNLLHARDNLERIIISTNDLFQIENKLPDEAREFRRNYLKNMFEIACDLYPGFDRASCNMQLGDTVEFVAAKGYDVDQLNRLRFRSDRFQWSWHTPTIVRNTNYNNVFHNDQDAAEFLATYGTLNESIRFTVIINEGEYAGMSFDHVAGSDATFTKQDIDNFASFQSLMNSYYKIGILTSERDQLKDDIVLSLVRTLELYDRYTGGHSEQVANLSALIAKDLGLSNAEIRTIYWAGIVHDIGKIGLPEPVLNKQGRLTPDEYELVKNHSIYGYDILSQSDGLKDIAQIVKHHHEWWNGRGYPDGLTGHEIPRLAQILHVCDAVDAMAQDRVYHVKKSPDEIVKELKRGLGEQFSPEPAEAMIQFIEQGRFAAYLRTLPMK